MADIKIKERKTGTIKKFDKATNFTKKLKDSAVTIKNKTNYNAEENTPNEYGGDKISQGTSIIFHKGIDTFNKYGKKSAKETAKNVQKITQKIKKKAEKRAIKTAQKTAKSTIKNTKRTIKTAKKTGKIAYKTAKNTAKITAKATKEATKRAVQIAKATAKATAQAIKVAIKVTIATIKAIILAIKGLIALIVAGGWVSVIIIVVIALIALICCSVYGIFFSSEEDVGDKTMSSVIAEINMEFSNKITEIQNNNEHEEYEINSNRAEWKEILAIYTVEISRGEEQTEVITLDDKKIEKLKDIFWEMNKINHRVEEVEKEIQTTDENGNEKTEKIKRKVLYIDITKTSVEEMMNRYNFTEKQRLQVAELTSEEYASLWNNVIYGSSVGSQDIVQVAKSQIGNKGGQPYWSWYGFNSRVEWCACFVSWCAEQCGYIQAGIIPKFASVNQEGVPFFKAIGLWKDGGYSPKRRRYNLF